jgi:hypothetical protein
MARRSLSTLPMIADKIRGNQVKVTSRDPARTLALPVLVAPKAPLGSGIATTNGATFRGLAAAPLQLNGRAACLA